MSSLSHKKHDVFISFRGADTRDNFTSHLHSALKRSGIKAYIDDRLPKGDEVWGSLSQAIEDSHMAVVVFSQEYAFSKWCLKELVKILECRETAGQVVIPVFYRVDPSDIRKQKGTYGEAFGKHERESSGEEVSEWKAALTKAANISGRDTRGREYKDESQVIDKIVEDVLQKLQLRFPDELKVKDLVGSDEILQGVKSLLSKSKNSQLPGNVHAIGIWGMGGIGKTTIARTVFSELFPHYDSVCFLENVREASQKIGQSKLTSLREKLHSELLKDEHLNSTASSEFIIRRLSSKKVFIVLDDVDAPNQIDELCRECSHAGSGSKLIITTRDRHLLTGIVDVDDIYEVKTWRFKESLELFCLSAFNERHPKIGYEDLSKRAVDYAGGVPLALKVLASILRSRSTKFWKDELNKVKKYPYDAIQNVLRVSYDGLDYPQQQIFLDIAFFFKDEDKDRVERILDAFYATSGLEVLEDRALIAISFDKIKMHDMVQDMGLNMVRQGIKDSGERIIIDSGKRSRLVDIEEVCEVLENQNKGSDAVEGIKLDLSQIDNRKLNPDAFSMMTKLRFLEFYIPAGKTSGSMDYPIVLNDFSGTLRYLEWHGCRLKSLPETIKTKWLVEIRMPHSHLAELWHGVKNLENLERIDLSGCKYLKTLPDLSKASKLKQVDLSGCESLVELHPSILSLSELETLILDGCKNLISLKSENHLRSLKTIRIYGCTKLKEFSVSSEKMKLLNLNNQRLEKLHPSVGRSSNLKRLTLEGLRLQNLPSELSHLECLEELRVKDCRNLRGLPDNINLLSELRDLTLDGSGVVALPSSIKHLSKLKILSLDKCKKLKYLPPELPAHIRRFYAGNCTSLVTAPTLKTFATMLDGNEKHKIISFENCKKLDGRSLHRILEGSRLSAMRAIFHNDVVRSIAGLTYHGFHFNTVKVVTSGSSVPQQLKYRSYNSSITINLPSLSKALGCILSAVLSPSDEMKKHTARVSCQCYRADGTELGWASYWDHPQASWELNSDHVYIWHDEDHPFRRFKEEEEEEEEEEVAFEFYAANDRGHRLPNISIKECGLCPTFDTDLHGLLRELGMDFRSKWRLGLDFASKWELALPHELEWKMLMLDMRTKTSESGENRSNDEHNQERGQNESRDVNNQERDLSERCYCFHDLFSAFCDYLKRMIRRETE